MKIKDSCIRIEYKIRKIFCTNFKEKVHDSPMYGDSGEQHEKIMKDLENINNSEIKKVSS